ncbi:MAG: hypothetical protein ACYC6Y_10410 [Thermoguttaceae bacterium]
MPTESPSTSTPIHGKKRGPLREIPGEPLLIESLAEELERNPLMLADALSRWRARTPEEERMREPTYKELATIMFPMWDKTPETSSPED